MEGMGMRHTNRYPLCNRVEDTEHRVNRCPYLEVPVQLIRDLCHP